MKDMEIRGVGSLLGEEQSGKVNAIGYDLYIEMLHEAISETVSYTHLRAQRD